MSDDMQDSQLPAEQLTANVFWAGNTDDPNKMATTIELLTNDLSRVYAALDSALAQVAALQAEIAALKAADAPLVLEPGVTPPLTEDDAHFLRTVLKYESKRNIEGDLFCAAHGLDDTMTDRMYMQGLIVRLWMLTPLGAAALAAYEAQSSSVAEWHDESGSERHVTQQDAAKRPTIAEMWKPEIGQRVRVDKLAFWRKPEMNDAEKREGVVGAVFADGDVSVEFDMVVVARLVRAVFHPDELAPISAPNTPEA